MRLVWPFLMEFKVRGYEVDSWGHVNNAVYLNWLEAARWEMFKAGEALILTADSVFPLVRHVEMSYERETRFGDTLRVGLWPRKVGTTSFTLGASIRIIDAGDTTRVGAIALLSTMVFACTRPGEGKAPVPEMLRQQFPVADPGPTPPEGA